MEFTIRLEDGPRWISHLELSRAEDGRVAIRVVKHSGDDYGTAYIADAKLVAALELL